MLQQPKHIKKLSSKLPVHMNAGADYSSKEHTQYTSPTSFLSSLFQDPVLHFPQPQNHQVASQKKEQQ
jgi:hypothetical protein